jgi:hypothetical protein
VCSDWGDLGLAFQFTVELFSSTPNLACHCLKTGGSRDSSLLISWLTLMWGEVERGELVVEEGAVAEGRGLGSVASCGIALRRGGREGAFELELEVWEVAAAMVGIEGNGVGVDCARGERVVRGGRVESSSEEGRLLRSRKYRNRSVSSFFISPFFVGFSGSLSPPFSSFTEEVSSDDGGVMVVRVVIVCASACGCRGSIRRVAGCVVAAVLLGGLGVLSSSHSFFAPFFLALVSSKYRFLLVFFSGSGILYKSMR